MVRYTNAATPIHIFHSDTLWPLLKVVVNDDKTSSDQHAEARRRAGMIQEIEAYLSVKFKKERKPVSEEYDSLQAVLAYFRRRNLGENRTRAAENVASNYGRGTNYSRRILMWADQWRENEEIKLSRRGKHAKTKNLLNEDDNFDEIRNWILENEKYTITPHLLRNHINDVFLPGIGIRRTISEATARRWLHALGWIHSRVKKGVYFDGHERQDVVEYREVFLNQMEEYERRMVTVDISDQTKVIEPILVNPTTLISTVFRTFSVSAVAI